MPLLICWCYKRVVMLQSCSLRVKFSLGSRGVVSGQKSPFDMVKSKSYEFIQEY